MESKSNDTKSIKFIKLKLWFYELLIKIYSKWSQYFIIKLNKLYNYRDYLKSLQKDK